MEFLGQDYLAKRIKDNQKFLLKLLNFHIGKYYPLRKWLGISFRGKIDDISHLSFGYDTKYIQKKGKWYKQQTREYQQPDLGYKLNLVLDKIPQLAFLPALLQPAYRLASVLLFSLTTTTYQPSTKDTYIGKGAPTTNCGTSTSFYLGKTNDGYYYWNKGLFHFDLSDIGDGATFSDATFSLYVYSRSYYSTPNGSYTLSRLLRTNWTENGATWNTYNGTNSWTTAGAGSDGNDYTSTNQLTKSPPLWGGSAGWVNWTSAQTLIQYCWDNASKQIHLIWNENWTDGHEWNNYYSREYTTDTSLRPKLTVTYTTEVTKKDTTALLSTLEAQKTNTVATLSDLQIEKKSPVAIQSTFEQEIKSTASLQSTLEQALKATASLYSLLEKYQVNTTALSSLLEKQGKSPVALTSLLEKSQSVTTAIQTLLETLKKSNVALTSQLEGQIKSTTALWTELEKILSGADTVALYSLLEKLTYATVSLQTTLEKCKGETVALSTFLQYERTSPVALQSTLEKALQITAAFQSTLEKVLTATISFQSTLEKAIENTVALSSTFETKKISTTALLSVLERKQQSVVALLTQLEYIRTTTTALYSTLEATKLNTVALYTDLNYLRTVSVALKSWLEGVSKGTIALRTLFEKTTQSTIPLLSVLRPFKVKHELDNYEKHSGLLDNLAKHTTHIHNIKKL